MHGRFVLVLFHWSEVVSWSWWRCVVFWLFLPACLCWRISCVDRADLSDLEYFHISFLTWVKWYWCGSWSWCCCVVLVIVFMFNIFMYWSYIIEWFEILFYLIGPFLPGLSPTMWHVVVSPLVLPQATHWVCFPSSFSMR